MYVQSSRQISLKKTHFTPISHHCFEFSNVFGFRCCYLLIRDNTTRYIGSKFSTKIGLARAENTARTGSHASIYAVGPFVYRQFRIRKKGGWGKHSK